MHNAWTVYCNQMLYDCLQKCKWIQVHVPAAVLNICSWDKLYCKQSQELYSYVI